MREPLHSLAIVRNFSHFRQQDEHNASLINMYGLANQTKGKNKEWEWNDKIYFLWDNRIGREWIGKRLTKHKTRINKLIINNIQNYTLMYYTWMYIF